MKIKGQRKNAIEKLLAETTDSRSGIMKVKKESGKTCDVNGILLSYTEKSV
jgi:hypothetical protein